MMKVRIFAVFVALAGCNQESSPSGPTASETTNAQASAKVVESPDQDAEAAVDDPVVACIRRGVTYFKMIGSYPTLKSAPNIGRDAVEVASERCARTTTAFP